MTCVVDHIAMIYSILFEINGIRKGRNTIEIKSLKFKKLWN